MWQENIHLIFYSHIWQREESNERGQESRGRVGKH